MKAKRTLPLLSCVLLASIVLESCKFIENQYISGGTWDANDIEIELDDGETLTINSLRVRIREIKESDTPARGCVTMKLSEYWYNVLVYLDDEVTDISYDHVSGTNVYYYDISDWEGYDMEMTLAFRDDFLKVDMTLYELGTDNEVSEKVTVEAEEVIETE